MKNLVAAILAGFSVLVFFFSDPGAAGAQNYAVILQYHHFGSDTPPSTSVTVSQFRQHLEYLKNNGFNVWPLDKIVSHLRQKKDLPDKCIAITIDDAYVSIYEKAFPLLKSYQWPFTVFVATRSVDRNSNGFLSWDQIREMAQNGGTFAGHTHSHAYLLRRNPDETDNQWRKRVNKDIFTARNRIKEEVGTDSKLFAYPYGEYDNRIKQIVIDLGFTGVGQHSGPVWTGSDFGALTRFAMAVNYADMEEFKMKVNTLPLPVVSAEPVDPLLAEETVKPLLQLTLTDGAYEKESLKCFLSGRGEVETRWISTEDGMLEVKSSRPLPPGRSRYNCTVRHRSSDRFFWYSHLWIRP